jgi:hypothetical protein
MISEGLFDIIVLITAFIFVFIYRRQLIYGDFDSN